MRYPTKKLEHLESRYFHQICKAFGVRDEIYKIYLRFIPEETKNEMGSNPGDSFHSIAEYFADSNYQEYLPIDFAFSIEQLVDEMRDKYGPFDEGDST